MRGLGTLFNTATVLLGGGFGLAFGNRIPDRISKIIVQVIGLATIAIGLRDLISTQNMVFPLVGMVLGAIVGEAIHIEDGLNRFGDLIRRKFSKSGDESKFVSGFVTATLLFCVGPLTILGAIEDASGRSPQLYLIKGTLDGFMMIIFATLYGIGSLFSAASVFVVQGTLTLLGTNLDAVLTDRMRLEMFAAGGLAVLAIGFNLLEIKKIRLGSLIPGLWITPLLVKIFAV